MQFLTEAERRLDEKIESWGFSGRKSLSPQRTDSQRLDEELAELEAANAAMEERLALKSRASYIAATDIQAAKEFSVVARPSSPILDAFQKLLGAFCVPCAA